MMACVRGALWILASSLVIFCLLLSAHLFWAALLLMCLLTRRRLFPSISPGTLLVAGLFAMLIPLEISWRDVAGPPRIIPYHFGLPDSEGRAAMARWNVLYGSDVVLFPDFLLPR